MESHSSKQFEAENSYWRSVLQRVVEVIRFLSERGLALRGDDELFGSPHNGNFLGVLEFLAKFDLFLVEHINKFGNNGHENANYLSSTICGELVCLMGNHVLQQIIKEVRKAKYFFPFLSTQPLTLVT